MKILLLSDVPPCRNFTTGLVLDQLCRFLPRGSIACFAPVNPNVNARLTPDLDFIPIAYTHKRNELANRRFPRPFTTLGATAVESLRRARVVPRLIAQAEKFARQQRVDRIWAVLQGQTLVQMAPVLADRLSLPLYTQVWDPLSWRLTANEIDPHNSKRAHNDFENALRKSRACATASWAMAEEFQRRFGTRCVPLIASHSPAIAQRPDLRAGVGDTVRIGMAGQSYAGEEWAHLIRALNFAGWKVHGKSVNITVAGRQEPQHDAPLGRVRFVGWQPQPDAARILSECDILYCPYPFGPAFAEVSRLSFPSKLVLYFCAGRPVLFHGPEYSSPYRFLKDLDAGVCVADSHAAAIYNGLSALVDDAKLYAHIGENGQRAFMDNFTLDTMRTSFFNFLGLSHREVAEAGAESAALPLPAVPVFLPDVRAISPLLAWVRSHSPRKSKRRLNSLQRRLLEEVHILARARKSKRRLDSLRRDLDSARRACDSMRSERDSLRSELDQTLGKLDYARLEVNSALSRILARVTLLEERAMPNGLDSVRNMGLKDKFASVYDKNLFKGRTTRSGEGSDLVQTAVIRREIPLLLKELGTQSVLDAPCGDWYWMREVNLGIELYIGVDIVEALIRKNQAEFGSAKTRFQCINLAEDELPQVDLIFSRDCLVHLSFDDALKVIRNFKRSGAKYLLTTTFVARTQNEDLGTGFWRPLNQQLAPFNFPVTLNLINENCTECGGLFTDKCLGLWLLQDINC